MFTPGSAGGRSVLVWEGPAALKAAGAQVGADRWCDTVGPVVVSYHTGGPSRSSRVLPGEMTRQLDGQFTALSLMSAKEILAGMATFDERKRSPASHTAIRQKFRDKLANNLWKRLDCWGFFGQCLFCASGCLLQVQEIAFGLVRGAIP